jgi:MoxR-like ATPase
MAVTLRAATTRPPKEAIVQIEQSTLTMPPSHEDVAWLRSKLNQVKSGLDAVIVGQEQMKQLLLCALLIDRRAVLLEGPPGLAKTLGTKALAALIEGEVGRVQGTHDLLAGDITGYMVPKQSATGSFAGFELRPGPIFKPVFFADDISRASEKALSGLIEALEEGQATIDGETFELPVTQVCISNMNPVEFIGTNQVPEAILDRHVGSAAVTYPNEQDEITIAQGSTCSVADLPPIITAKEIQRARKIIKDLHRTADADMVARAVRLVRKTADADVFVHRASPRASQDTMLLASVFAVIRDVPTPNGDETDSAPNNGALARNKINLGDIQQASVLALRHRVVFTPEFAQENRGVTVANWVAQQTI